LLGFYYVSYFSNYNSFKYLFVEGAYKFDRKNEYVFLKIIAYLLPEILNEKLELTVTLLPFLILMLRHAASDVTTGVP
jgi:hypothetical protein